MALGTSGRSGSAMVLAESSSQMISCGVPVGTSGEGVDLGSGVSSVPLPFITQLRE